MSKKITGRKRDVNPRLKDRIENRKTKIWQDSLFCHADYCFLGYSLD